MAVRWGRATPVWMNPQPQLPEIFSALVSRGHQVFEPQPHTDESHMLITCPTAYWNLHLAI